MYTQNTIHTLSLSLSLSHILPIFNTNFKINNLNINFFYKVKKYFSPFMDSLLTPLMVSCLMVTFGKEVSQRFLRTLQLLKVQHMHST
jgi:hypothetical protein